MVKMNIADSSHAWLALLEDKNKFIIRSLDDFDSVVSGKTPVRSNPFPKLSANVLAEFRSSLTFNGGGLAHAEYGALKGALNDEDFYSVWELFGISRILFRDYQDKYCATNEHTCYRRLEAVCTSNC